jgi:hypothetical protein
VVERVKVGGGALVQCREGMMGEWAGGELSGGTTTVEHVVLAWRTHGESGNDVSGDC